jgi:acyl-homoserine-lactone acylase
LKLEKRKIKLNIKGVPIPIFKTVYNSIYGPTVATPNGVYFSMRLPSLMDAGALQQWYAMNKAQNFTGFKKALEQNHLPMFNIMYADKMDTIFYISNGKMPYRNPDTAYHWNSTVPGNTMATLWNKFKPLSELPQQLNPESGYLFNTNHSPFLATDVKYNLDPKKYDVNDGYETYHNNRSQRAKDLIDPLDKISYEALKRIKFDQSLPTKILFPYGFTADSLFMVDENKYPALAPIISTLKQWDHAAVANSKGAAIYNLAYYMVPQIMEGRKNDKLTLEEALVVYKKIDEYLQKHFGRTDIVLGDLQKLVRGGQSWPQGGMPDVLAAVMSEPYKDGTRKMNSGDAYINIVRFPKDGSLPHIESVNTFGASMHKESKHFADQRAMYQAQVLKPMTLDKYEVIKKAEKVYHPGM